ncbi:MAG: hypothetical protein NVSMB32_05060 [Actinomycetota bacterium]
MEQACWLPADRGAGPLTRSLSMDETQAPAHVPGVSRGEEVLEREGKEPGRYSTGVTGDAGRPTGTSSARDDTGIDPQEPIDSDSPPKG